MRYCEKIRMLRRNNQWTTTVDFGHKNTETLFHITTGCPEVSSSLYLNIRHKAAAKVIFQCIIYKNEGTNHRMNKEPEPITNYKDLEIWWDRPITLPRKIPHNRPDTVIWDKVSLTCTIIDISIPLDLNISCSLSLSTGHLSGIDNPPYLIAAHPKQTLGTISNIRDEEL